MVTAPANPKSIQRPPDVGLIPVRRPELLSPAGTWDCARAAVENGADAIYFGLSAFNARLRAGNFTAGDLPALMRFLHGRGVRGYVTFNTLVFADELEAAEEALRVIIAAGADAVIVQDVGICRLIRKLSPDFPIHASTQMTVTSAAGVAMARELGASLVVLARECSIAEMERIQAEQLSAHVELPIEVFVHGALCVAYSGQCLTSEALGGRSANRGECAQACRMPYELVVDGKVVPLGDRRYLLSPQDLSGLERLPQLIRAGVSSLKIEGRLKTPEYVAAVTRAYRDALDRAWEAVAPGASPTEPRPRSALTHPAGDLGSESALATSLRRDHRYALEMSFSRGLYSGWLDGNRNQELAHARFGTKRGVALGPVTRREANGVWIRAAAPVKPGDGIVFDRGRPDESEEGGRIHGVEPGPRGETFLRFGRDDVDWSRVGVGDLVWKTSDPALERELKATVATLTPLHRRPVDIDVHGHAGAQLTVEFRDRIGHVVSASSAQPLEPAQGRGLDDSVLAAQLGRLGGTAYRLGDLANHLEGPVHLPVSELNRLRRELVAALDAARTEPPRWTLASDPAAKPMLEAIREAADPIPADLPPRMLPVARSREQLEAILRLRGGDARAASSFDTVYLEFEDPKRYADAVAAVRAFTAQARQGRGLLAFVAPPRVFKPTEDWIVEQVARADADGVLLRNAEHLRRDWGRAVRRGDFSLNVANPLAAAWLRERWALDRVTASYDLNIRQLDAMLDAAPASWFEVTLHQPMPLFHMEHCVFCAFLSTGQDYRDCGRPCEKHSVKLRDRAGAEHPLKADAGCRNTLYNARAQTGAEFAPHLIAKGVRHFRIEFLEEDAVTVERTLDRYARLLAGELSGGELWRDLRLFSQLGVTRGTLDGERAVVRKPVAARVREQRDGRSR